MSSNIGNTAFEPQGPVIVSWAECSLKDADCRDGMEVTLNHCLNRRSEPHHTEKMIRRRPMNFLNSKYLFCVTISD